MARIQVTPSATSPSPQVQALKARARKKTARAQQPEPVDIKECRWVPSGKSGRYRTFQFSRCAAHIRYMRIGCMQSTLWPILMTMLIWNDLMNSQHDNLSRGSPRLMTSDRQILYPHIPLAVTPLVALRLRRSRSSSSSPSRRRRRLPLVGVDVGEFCLTFEFCLTLIAF